MNVKKTVNYNAMFAAQDMLMAAALPQMKLYVEIGWLVSTRPEKGAAVAAAEYLCGAYPDASGFSPRNLRRMRDFYRTYENAPETLAQAMSIGWTQNVAILEAKLTLQERAWYLQATRQFGWSKLELQRKIIANAHMDSILDFSDTACYTEENSVVAEPQKACQEENTMDWLIEMGLEAGSRGKQVVAERVLPDIMRNPVSQTGPFLSGKAKIERKRAEGDVFSNGRIYLSTGTIHTVKPLEADIPKGRLTVVTGVSDFGKTTLILESLMPGFESAIHGKTLSEHVLSVETEGIRQVKLIDATPMGINVRSTVATYANIHDELRKLFACTPDTKAHGYKAGDFSYNTGSLRCSICNGTGIINLEVQFLPDVGIPCPYCGVSRYSREAGRVMLNCKHGGAFSLPQLMDMDINTALDVCADQKLVSQRLQVLKDLGLGYLTLGEETPSLSGGEAQRLKLASEMGGAQDDSVFIFDEPTIGLHPLDVRTLLGVFQTLIDSGATVIVWISFAAPIISLTWGPAAERREAAL